MITIVKRPEQYTPAGNPVIWQIQSNNNNLVYFEVNVLEPTASGATILNQNIFPTPEFPTGSYINLSKILDSTVRGELNPSTDLVKPITKSIRDYRLAITEMVATGGTITTGDTYNNTSEINYVWEAELTRDKFRTFNDDQYVINIGHTATFLTNKPDYVEVNDSSVEYLYFLQNTSGTTVTYTNPYNVSFSYSNDNGTTRTVTISFANIPSGIVTLVWYYRQVGTTTWYGANAGGVTSPKIMSVPSGVVLEYKCDMYTASGGFVPLNTIYTSHLDITVTTYDAINVVYSTYDANNNLIDTYTVSLTGDTDRMYRADVSPSAVQRAGLSLTNIVYYTVSIVDDNGDPLTDVRTYVYKPTECGKEYVNICFLNSLGGVDGAQFHSPVETHNFNKFQVKQNTLGLDSNSQYGDNSDGIFNPSEVTINNTVASQIRVTSEPLSDADAYWLIELFKTKQAWVKLSSGMFAPIELQNPNYQVARLRLSRGQLNVITVDFNMVEGIEQL